MNRIYFDNNATTPMAPEVRAAMLPFLTDNFGNPSSGHREGELARAGVDNARAQVAGLLNVAPPRITFTSGGSEANNLAIFSAAAADPARRHLIAARVEHASVLAPLRFLAEHGYELTLLEVEGDGGLDLDRLRAAIRADTALVSLMGANNETGVLWPLAEIGALCREHGVLCHSDVVQLLGKESIDAAALPVDYLSMAAHKLHGPKGVGALYAARRAPLTPLIRGAGQETGKRAGTENTHGIAGFGQACELAATQLTENRGRIAGLRDRLEAGILAATPEALIIGKTQPRLSNTVNVCFKHCSSAGLVQELDVRGIAVSGHSACHSGDLDPSHVLSAMGVPETHLHGSLRVSLSRYSTEAEVERFLAVLPEIVGKSSRNFAA
ncbi:MAG TPA: aminotransferase class V-fold PLP-dependent enzyme [Desulfurivibrionaceae bacterium]|nr:aminotransferase class V-fold PLP-dependent enzyme [Desulfurivibrionaceae bacterium]